MFQLPAKELQRRFSPQVLTTLTKQTQFVQRTSKFRAQDLFSIYIGVGQDTASHSLAKLSVVLESETGVFISILSSYSDSRCYYISSL